MTWTLHDLQALFWQKCTDKASLKAEASSSSIYQSKDEGRGFKPEKISNNSPADNGLPESFFKGDADSCKDFHNSG